MITRGRAIDYLNTQSRIYVVDGFAGWDANYQIKVRIITTRPYHALFMHNMLIRPSNEQLDNFGEPDFVIFNAGQYPADPLTKHMTSTTSVELDFDYKPIGEGDVDFLSVLRNLRDNEIDVVLSLATHFRPANGSRVEAMKTNFENIRNLIKQVESGD